VVIDKQPSINVFCVRAEQACGRTEKVRAPEALLPRLFHPSRAPANLRTAVRPTEILQATAAMKTTQRRHERKVAARTLPVRPTASNARSAIKDGRRSRIIAEPAPLSQIPRTASLCVGCGHCRDAPPGMSCANGTDHDKQAACRAASHRSQIRRMLEPAFGTALIARRDGIRGGITGCDGRSHGLRSGGWIRTTRS
jgi:hypothetical protein